MKKLLFFIIFALLALNVYGFRYTYQTGDFSIKESNNYELVQIQNGNQFEQEYGIVAPYSTKEFEFEPGKALKDARVFRFLEQVEITANLPVLEYDERDGTTRFVDRDCDFNELEAHVSATPFYGEKTLVKVEFYPLRMEDCENNKFVLYKALDTELEFYEQNKIKSIDFGEIKPGEEVTFTVNFEEILEGKLVVKEADTEEIFAEKAISGQDKIEITFTATNFADQAYKFEYYENDELVDIEVITASKDWGDIDFRVLISEDKLIFPLAIETNNILSEDIKLDITLNSLNDILEVDSTTNKEITAPPGKNIVYTDFTIAEDETVNDIELIATYNGISKTVLYNSLVRFTKSEVSNGLPPPPGEKIRENIAEIAQNLTKEASLENKEKKAISSRLANTIGITLALILTLAVIYIAFKYMRTKPEE